jgi:uncharacterized protein (DUF486 family)
MDEHPLFADNSRHANGEAPRWNYVGSFACIMGAVMFAFWGKL